MYTTALPGQTTEQPTENILKLFSLMKKSQSGIMRDVAFNTSTTKVASSLFILPLSGWRANAKYTVAIPCTIMKDCCR